MLGFFSKNESALEIDDELAQLQQQFLSLQEQPSTDSSIKLSESTCVDVLQKLIQRKKLPPLIMTTKGDSCLTSKRADEEIEYYIVSSGRITIPDLTEKIGVSLEYVKNRLPHILKKQQDDVLYLRDCGELLTSGYRLKLCSRINNELELSGKVALTQLSKTFHLPATYVGDLINKHVGTDINGVLVNQDVLTHGFFRLQESIVRGVLIAARKPVKLSNIEKQFGVPTETTKKIIDKLLKSQDPLIKGTVGEGVFTPDSYVSHISEEVERFFEVNGYVAFKYVKDRGYTHPPKTLQNLFRDDITILNNYGVRTRYAQAIENAVETVKTQKGWADLTSLLPNQIPSECLQELLRRALGQEHDDVCLFFDDLALFSTSLIQRLADSLEPQLVALAVGAYIAQETQLQKETPDVREIGDLQNKNDDFSDDEISKKKRGGRKKKDATGSQNKGSATTKRDRKVTCFENTIHQFTSNDVKLNEAFETVPECTDISHDAKRWLIQHQIQPLILPRFELSLKNQNSEKDKHSSGSAMPSTDILQGKISQKESKIEIEKTLTRLFETLQVHVKGLTVIAENEKTTEETSKLPLVVYFFKTTVADIVDHVLRLAGLFALGHIPDVVASERSALLQKIIVADGNLKSLEKLVECFSKRNLQESCGRALNEIYLPSHTLNKKEEKKILADQKTRLWNKFKSLPSTEPVDVLCTATALAYIQTNNAVLHMPNERWAVESVWPKLNVESLKYGPPLKALHSALFPEPNDDKAYITSCAENLLKALP